MDSQPAPARQVLFSLTDKGKPTGGDKVFLEIADEAAKWGVIPSSFDE